MKDHEKERILKCLISYEHEIKGTWAHGFFGMNAAKLKSSFCGVNVYLREDCVEICNYLGCDKISLGDPCLRPKINEYIENRMKGRDRGASIREY